MTALADLARHLDAALAATVELSDLLRMAGATTDVVAAADFLDSDVLALAESDMAGEHGRQFTRDLRDAAGQAVRLVEALAWVDGSGLPLMLARLDANEVCVALHGALAGT